MFNTFGNDPNDPFQANKIKMREKDKIIEELNIKNIQLLNSKINLEGFI